MFAMYIAYTVLTKYISCATKIARGKILHLREILTRNIIYYDRKIMAVLSIKKYEKNLQLEHF
jgi:hypothetical protein